MIKNKLLCEHEKKYVAKKGRRKVFNNYYTVSKKEVSVFAVRILKSPFVISYDTKSQEAGSNKLYWNL